VHSYSTSENVLYVIARGAAYPGMSTVDSTQLLGTHFTFSQHARAKRRCTFVAMCCILHEGRTEKRRRAMKEDLAHYWPTTRA